MDSGNLPLWSDLAAECMGAASHLPPLPPFLEARMGDRSRSFIHLGYTFWNQELLDSLAAHLLALQAERPDADGQRVTDPPPAMPPFRWVELAAGTGRWSAELGRRGVAVAATDNFAQQHPPGCQRTIDYGSWVGRYSARDAVAHLQPHGVLCAWPPLGSGLVLDLLQRGWPGSEALWAVVCIGEPSGATEAPEHPSLLPPGWELRRWSDCDRYLVGFNDPPSGPGWRSYSQLLVYVRTQQRTHTGISGAAAELET